MYNKKLFYELEKNELDTTNGGFPWVAVGKAVFGK